MSYDNNTNQTSTNSVNQAYQSTHQESFQPFPQQPFERVALGVYYYWHIIKYFVNLFLIFLGFFLLGVASSLSVIIPPTIVSIGVMAFYLILIIGVIFMTFSWIRSMRCFCQTPEETSLNAKKRIVASCVLFVANFVIEYIGDYINAGAQSSVHETISTILYILSYTLFFLSLYIFYTFLGDIGKKTLPSKRGCGLLIFITIFCYILSISPFFAALSPEAIGYWGFLCILTNLVAVIMFWIYISALKYNFARFYNLESMKQDNSQDHGFDIIYAIGILIAIGIFQLAEYSLSSYAAKNVENDQPLRPLSSYSGSYNYYFNKDNFNFNESKTDDASDMPAEQQDSTNQDTLQIPSPQPADNASNASNNLILPPDEGSEASEFPPDLKLTPEEETKLDEAIKKAQESNAEDASTEYNNVSSPDEDSEAPEFSINKKLTPEEEAKLDEEIKKAQEFNAADYQEPELTPEQEEELKEKQKQADSSRANKDEFLSIASETPRKTLIQQAIENDAIGHEGDYPDSVLDPNSPDYDWKAAINAKPLTVELGEPLVDNPDDLVRLHPKQNIWFDKKNKTAVLHGAVGLTRGPLELFACTGRVTRDRSSKERIFADGPKAHESVVVFDIIPHLMHAALLAAGAQPGKPAVFSPQFVPPSGALIEVTVRWKDEQGNVQQCAAGEWVLDEETKEVMKTPFVFTGSMFMVNRDGRRMYMGDADGELICVSNFPSAVMDVPIESSVDNNSRLFIANEAKIPPCGTPVTMILKPIEDSSQNQGSEQKAQ